MIQHTERWGRGGGRWSVTHHISHCHPPPQGKPLWEKGRGGRFTAAKPASRSSENTPRYSKMTYSMSSLYSLTCQKAKKKQKRGEKAHEKHKETNNPTHRNPTFKTGRATRHLHVLAPTKISRYIEEYTGPDRNEPKREKTRGRKLLCTWNSSISGVAEGSQNINNT